MDDLPLVTFVFLSMLGMAVPGPDVVLAISNGSRFGIRPAFVGTAGVVLSDFVIIGSVAVGFGALLSVPEFYLSIARMAGSGYLLVQGAAALRNAARPRIVDDRILAPRMGSSRALVLRCFVVAVTNPQAWMFFPSALPPFVNIDEPVALQYAVLAVIVATCDVIVLMIYAALGSRAARMLAGPNVIWIDRLYGAALLVLSGVLVVQTLALN